MQKVATGHTRSDQAETVLYRLLRGAGSAGLAGIRPVTDFGAIRPLLRVTRSQVEGWLKERAIDWRQDATNAELRFDRNRIRHQLLPMLEAEWNPGLQETLAQTADWAQEEEQYWRLETGELASNWVRFAKGAALLEASPAQRASRRGCPPADPGDRATGEGRPARSQLHAYRSDPRTGGWKAGRGPGADRGHRSPSVLQLASFRKIGSGPGRLDWEAEDWAIPVSVPGHYVVPPTTIELELVRNEGVYNSNLDALDGERVCGPLVLRNWRAGDEYRRRGHAGVEKVKNLFQEYRIPLWERQNWPIITIGSRIAWASRFGPAAEFAVNRDSRTVLRIHETRETHEAEKV